MHDQSFWLSFQDKARQAGSVGPEAKALAIQARAGLPIIDAEIERAEKTARPATPEEILFELELLESRYHRPDHDKQTAKALARQWVEDLLEVEISIGDLRDCCKRWRMSREAFAPRSAGQLLGDKHRQHEARLFVWRHIRESAVGLAERVA
jgi:hypothetical protein